MAEQPKTGSNRTLWIGLGAVGLFAALGLCMALLAAGLLLAGGRDEPPTSRAVVPERSVPATTPAPAAAPPAVVPAQGTDYETAVLMSIYEKVNPSVVNVTVLSRGDSLNLPFPVPEITPESPDAPPPFELDPEDLIPQSQGSGFVWDREGHIVTNAHVVQDADQVQVSFYDGTATVAEVVGIDLDSDLAVLRVDPEGYSLAPVELGNMDEVRVGARVAAIGNPFGYRGTLTSGIVSALGRSISSLRSPFNIPDAIQTDAAINPGNSGGPLLNEKGQVIGVNAQISSDRRANSGVGFAIPVSIVKRVIPALITEGRYEHSYIGIRGMTYNPICADDLDLPKTVRGAYVIEVLEDTPAARAGLRGGFEESGTHILELCPEVKGGDLILAFDDLPVTRFDDLLIYLARYTSPGDKVTLTLLRDGEEIQVGLTLAARPRQLP